MSALDQAALEEQLRLLDQIERQKAGNQCRFCNCAIEKGQGTVLIQSDDCFHTVHQECFRLNAKQALTEGQDLFCPECGKQISTIEQRQYLSKEELDGIE